MAFIILRVQIDMLLTFLARHIYSNYHVQPKATCRTYEGFITDIVQDIITIYDGQHHVRIKNTGAWVLEIYDEVT